MKMFDSNDNFSNVYSNFVFCELLSLIQVGEKFASIHIICGIHNNNKYHDCIKWNLEEDLSLLIFRYWIKSLQGLFKNET